MKWRFVIGAETIGVQALLMASVQSSSASFKVLVSKNLYTSNCAAAFLHAVSD